MWSFSLQPECRPNDTKWRARLNDADSQFRQALLGILFGELHRGAGHAQFAGDVGLRLAGLDAEFLGQSCQVGFGIRTFGCHRVFLAEVR